MVINNLAANKKLSLHAAGSHKSVSAEFEWSPADGKREFSDTVQYSDSDTAMPPVYTETQQSREQLQSWIKDGCLYAIVDGLEQPGLAALAAMNHPEVDTALYGNLSDPQYRQISPHILRVDNAVLAWLTPIIENDPAWGWFMRLRATCHNGSSNSLLQKLVGHFRLWYVVPNGSADGTTIFRLQDASVLQHWVAIASSAHIQAFMEPLASFSITRDGDKLCSFSLVDPASSGTVPQMPADPWPQAMLKALDVQHKNERLQTLTKHLRDYHPLVNGWEAARLYQFVIDNGNCAFRLGFDTPNSMAKYLSLCVELGPDFTEGEKGAWARAVLKKSSVNGQASTIDTLVKEATARLKQEFPA